MKRSSMQLKIPNKMREQLADDPYMAHCILEPLFCDGRIQWHHAFSYAGKRKNELWAILPMCEEHHKTEGAHRYAIGAAMKNRIAHFGAQEEVAVKYPRAKFV